MVEGWAPTLSCSCCPYSFLHLLCPNPPIHILTVLLTPPIPPSRSDLHFSAMQSKKFSPSSLFHISSLLAPRAQKATSSSHSARRSFHSLCFFHRLFYSGNICTQVILCALQLDSSPGFCLSCTIYQQIASGSLRLPLAAHKISITRSEWK